MEQIANGNSGLVQDYERNVPGNTAAANHEGERLVCFMVSCSRH